MRLFQWHGQLDAGTCAGLRLTVHRRCEDPRGERRGEERVVPSLRGPGAVRPSPAGSLHHARGSPGPTGAGDQPWALWDLWGQGPRSVLSPSCPWAMHAPNYVQPQREPQGRMQPIGAARASLLCCCRRAGLSSAISFELSISCSLDRVKRG